MYSAGTRASETVGLDRKDLDLSHGVARVLGKGRKERLAMLGSAARQAIEDIWQQISGGWDAPRALTVQGRTVELPRYANGAARARFYDLCGKSLGPADYLRIAEEVDILVLENVPTLGRGNFNEAKRFVTLIDALYEAGTQLVVSAAASPDYLYVEGPGAFEFERTASRLMEMQSDTWGQDVPQKKTEP